MKGEALPLVDPPARVVISPHALEQARSKDIEIKEIVGAFREPEIEYPSTRHPGQVRRIKGRLCIVLSDRLEVITIYLHLVETPVRPDQEVES